MGNHHSNDIRFHLPKQKNDNNNKKMILKKRSLFQKSFGGFSGNTLVILKHRHENLCLFSWLVGWVQGGPEKTVVDGMKWGANK